MVIVKQKLIYYLHHLPKRLQWHMILKNRKDSFLSAINKKYKSD